MSTCAACGARLRWTQTVRHKSMPLDFEPNPDGNVVLRSGRAVVVDSDAEGVRYMPHWATCTDSPRFRR